MASIIAVATHVSRGWGQACLVSPARLGSMSWNLISTRRFTKAHACAESHPDASLSCCQGVSRQGRAGQ